ncbi:MAG: class I SAM-dependent methyltransferase, partial [Burkholderiales bacterium]
KPHVLLELGAGDGSFMLRLARRLAPRWKNVKVILLDRQNIVSGETRDSFYALKWKVQTVTADVFDFLKRAEPRSADIITANLFLHHFPQEPLARLLAQAAQLTRLFVACEPRRGMTALLGSRMLWAIGCNDVSRHDAAVSVRAGFKGQELTALWPKQGEWELYEQAARYATHCFVARRCAAPR